MCSNIYNTLRSLIVFSDTILAPGLGTPIRTGNCAAEGLSRGERHTVLQQDGWIIVDGKAMGSQSRAIGET